MNSADTPRSPGSPDAAPSTEAGATATVCSAKGCRATAVWVVVWNNPKVHTPDRRKTWVACEEHREHLSHFLDLRGFLKDVVTLEEWESVPRGD
ncbi:hypothetical protein [Streptomyces sp. H27-C3]|uniref:hypothetical protein n=1 Tax=Streptomyces sp. H27-C3 TaxID=3046305 RepID=UPI0024BB4242|nr:hypothetical protein [Streptomyces sp. H27-C3]MDJ0461857.1 hypothetical protein [Streptomyces sp. H27-C3]